MYPGWLTLGGVEVVNNHRTARYARNGGLSWLKGCTTCNGIWAADGLTYRMPRLDDPHPPWWDGSKDAGLFYGMYGLALDGADSATRQVERVEGVQDGGYLGSPRDGIRTMTLSGVLAADSDSGIGFGLAWLRSLDPATGCTPVNTGVYESCPCICDAECDDQECLDDCVRIYQREFRSTRIISGPTVLLRRPMSVGHMARVEIQIAAADPHAYSPPFATTEFLTLGGLIADA